MNEKDLAQHIKRQLVDSSGWEGDEVALDREKALDYYFQRPRGDEVAGRAQVVSGDLSSMVEANLAQMLESFSSDRIAEFDPLDGEDEDQAQLESDAVTYFVMSKANGFMVLSEAIKDALIQRNGITKVFVEERKTTSTKTFKDMDPIALAALPENADVKSYDPEKREAKIKFSHVRKAFRFSAVPPENFLFHKDHDSLDLQTIKFCAERHTDTRSDLIELFPDKKKAISKLSKKLPFKIDAEARKPARHSQSNASIDKSQDELEWFECYAMFDSDGDGIAERHKVCIVEDVILEDEFVDLVPYAAGTAIINPHRFLGISLWDKLRQTQDKTTGLERALLDNVNTVTKNRLAYLDGKVNVDDVSDGRPNGALRVKSNVADVRQAVMPFQVPDNSANVLQNLAFQKSQRSEMGGAALDMQTAQLQVGGDRMGSQGLDRAYSVAEQLAALFTKWIAQSLIRNSFLLAHATLRANFEEPVPVKRQGKWESPVPSEWPARECVTVKPGMSPGERARKAAALGKVLDSQIALAEKGMDEVLVNVEGFYRVLMDWARVSDVQNPEQYFVDPQSDAAKEAFTKKAQQAQKDTQLRQALMQQAIGMEQLRIAVDKNKADADRQFNYWKEVLGAEVEEAKIAGKATVELLKAKEDGRAKQKGSAGAEGKPAPAKDTVESEG